MAVKGRLVIFTLAVTLIFSFLWVSQKKVIHIRGNTMGTTYEIKCYVSRWVSEDSIKRRIDNELDLLTNVFSTWNTDSEISNFNRQKTTKFIDVSDHLLKVVIQSKIIFEYSAKHFDPTLKPLIDLWGFSSIKQKYRIPSEEAINRISAYIGMDKLVVNEKDKQIKKLHPNLTLDFSAIAKGYAVDYISNIIDIFYSKRFMVEIGGEVSSKSPRRSKYWTIGISRPDYNNKTNKLFTTVQLRDNGLATSGDYRNYFIENNEVYSHIFDPLEKMPVKNNIASVTVIAQDCLTADALATAVLSLGKDQSLALIESLEDVEVLIIERSGDDYESYFSTGFSNYNKNIEELM